MLKLVTVGRQATAIGTTIAIYALITKAMAAGTSAIKATAAAKEKFPSNVPDYALKVKFSANGNMIHGPSRFKWGLEKAINCALATDPVGTSAALKEAGFAVKEVAEAPSAPAEVKA